MAKCFLSVKKPNLPKRHAWCDTRDDFGQIKGLVLVGGGIEAMNFFTLDVDPIELSFFGLPYGRLSDDGLPRENALNTFTGYDRDAHTFYIVPRGARTLCVHTILNAARRSARATVICWFSNPCPQAHGPSEKRICALESR